MAIVAAALIAAGSSAAITRFAHAKEQPKAEPVHLVVDNTAPKRDGHFTTSFSPVVKKVAPSVVKVFTTITPKHSEGGNPSQEEFLRRFFGDQFEGGSRGHMEMQKQHGLGSGVIVSKDGYILTNNHVVENADEIKVAVNETGEEFTAKVVGADPKSDVAVLKIDGKDLPAISLADSDKIEVGDLVLAVGNPFGIGQTVTMGMVSAMGRASMGMEYEDFIQTDAAINPGNSGGALVDAEGRLIGINTAILSRSGGNQGIGFAVPINLARFAMESIIKDGHVVRGFLGVNIQDVTPALAKEFKIENAQGALVSDVTPKSPADKAGLKSGDVITEFNGKAVHDSRHLKLQVAQVPPTTKVPVKIVRDGDVKTLNVTLKEFPQTELASKGKSESRHEDALDGVTIADLDSNTRSQMKVPAAVKGVIVTQVEQNSAAYAAGLREGDVIEEVNRQPLTNAEQAVALSEKLKDEKSILLRIWSKGGSHYLVVDESKVG
jgi:serine protease Do